MALTAEDEIFLDFVVQCFVSEGLLPTEARIKEAGFEKTQWRRLLNSQPYLERLIAEGIPKGQLIELRSGRRDRKVLSELQMTAVATYMDLHDPNSQRKKLAELGIPSNTWAMWLRDPVFQQYIQQRATNMLKDNRHEGIFSLLQKVRAGDIRAIETYLDVTGVHSKTPVGHPSNNSGSPLDVKAFLVRVMETIQKHVPNPDVMDAIANELLSYAQAEGFASRVMVELEPINLPIPDDVPRHQLSLVAPPLPDIDVTATGGL